MSYNLTNLTGAYTPLAVINGVNEISNGAFYIGLIISLFFIILISTINRGFVPSITASVFITSMLAIILTLTGGLSTTFLAYWLIGSGLAVAGAFIASRRE